METETGCSVITMAVEKQDAEVETTQQAKPRGWLPAGGQAHRSCKRGAPAPIPGGRETRKWGDARPPVPRGCHQPFLGGPLGPKRTTGTSCAAGQGEGGSPRPSCPLAPRQPLTFLHRFAGGSFPASGAAGQALGGSSPGEAAAAAAPAAGGTAALGAQTGAGGGGSGPSSRHGDGRARRPPGPGRPGSRLSAWPGRGLGGLPPPPPQSGAGPGRGPRAPLPPAPWPGKGPAAPHFRAAGPAPPPQPNRAGRHRTPPGLPLGSARPAPTGTPQEAPLARVQGYPYLPCPRVSSPLPRRRPRPHPCSRLHSHPQRCPHPSPTGVLSPSPTGVLSSPRVSPRPPLLSSPPQPLSPPPHGRPARRPHTPRLPSPLCQGPQAPRLMVEPQLRCSLLRRANRNPTGPLPPRNPRRLGQASRGPRGKWRSASPPGGCTSPSGMGQNWDGWGWPAPTGETTWR